MASRSFKPASYLASAAQGQSRNTRPSFTRTSSSSSTKSEDALYGAFKALNLSDQPNEDKNSQRKGQGKGKENATGTSLASSSPLGPNSSTSHKSYFEDKPLTPGRTNSKPIAIELPGRDPRQVYTPLSARGDLPGGYFPNHEEITRSYKTHPFSSHHQRQESSFDFDSASEMSTPALGSPVTDATPRGPPSLVAPSYLPEPLMMPMGKYHPSNYKSTTSSAVSTPSIPAPTSIPAPFPSNNLSIPKTIGKRNTAGRPGHERKSSDVKRKIQQYQRDMILQAQLAGGSSAMKAIVHDPIGPKLLPLGSPGPITPLELEESAGYMLAGSATGRSTAGAEIDRSRERQLEMVDGMIRKEEKRRNAPTTSMM